MIFVLVHGAWHGGWCWERVAPLLRAAGHRVFAPSLTGLGDRAHLLDERVNLTTHVNDIATLIESEGLTDVVLVGHSYGCAVITCVADRMPQRLRAAVFLDGQVAIDGVAVADRAPRKPGPGVSTPPPPAAAFMVNERDRAWVDAHTTPNPNAAFLEKPYITGRYKDVVRKVLVRASTYNSAGVAALYAELATNPDWSVREIASGHDLMIDAPEAVATILLELA